MNIQKNLYKNVTVYSMKPSEIIFLSIDDLKNKYFKLCYI